MIENGTPTHTIDSDVQIQADAAWSVENAATLIVNGNISESGGPRSLTKSGAGTLRLGGNNTYTGVTNINAGTLAIDPTASALPNNDVFISAGATLDLLGGPETIGPLSGGGNVFLGAGPSPGVLITMSDAFTTFSGNISGVGELHKSGTGGLVLSGSNSYTGNTVIQSGTIVMGPGGADSIPSQSTVDIASGAGLDMNDNSESIGALTGDGDVFMGSSGFLPDRPEQRLHHLRRPLHRRRYLRQGRHRHRTLTLTGNNNLYTGTVTVSGGTLVVSVGTLPFDTDVTNNANLEFNQTFASQYDGDISGTGSLTKTGAGELTLTGNHSYAGDTHIQAGQLTMGPTSDSIPDNSTVHIDDAGFGTLDLNDQPEVIGALAGDGLVFMGDAGTAFLQTGFNNASTTFSGNLRGSGIFDKLGTGTLTLAGTDLDWTVPRLHLQRDHRP